MPDPTYQELYDKAAAELEAAANGVKPAAITAPEVKTESAPAAVPETPTAPPVAPVVTDDPAKQAAEPPKPDPAKELEEFKTRLGQTEKALKDTQAWGTKNAQKLREIEQERLRAEREANKPAILQQNPELEEVVRYVVGDPKPQIEAEQEQMKWLDTVNAAHPGIFDASIDRELENAIVARREEAQKLGSADWSDPLVAIREITAAKLAHAEQQVGKRFAAEAAKLQQKSAMSVPGAGSSAVAMQPVDKQLEEVNRIKNMSSADFEREVRRVKGLL